VDTVIVGRLLGTAQLAAVGSASIAVNLFIFLCVSFGGGFAVVVAQYFGANDKENLNKSLGSSYILMLIIVILLTFIGLVLSKPIANWTKIPQEIQGLSISYFRIIISGLIFSCLYNLLTYLLRSFGDSTIPLIFLSVSVSLNIVFDYVSIKYLGLGVNGAALSTVLAQAISGIGCLIFCIFRRKFLFIKKESFKFDKGIYEQVFTQGLSMALMMSVVLLSSVILQVGINSLGTDMIAGYMAGRKFLELFLMVGTAFEMTSVNFVGQNFGAKNFERIRKGVTQILIMDSAWWIIAVTIVLIFGRSLVITVVGANAAEEIILAGRKYLIIGVIAMISLPFFCVGRFSLQGMNHKKIPVVSSLMELLIKTLAVMVFVPYLGFLGVCIAEPVVWLVNALWIYPVYRVVLKKETLISLKQND